MFHRGFGIGSFFLGILVLLICVAVVVGGLTVAIIVPPIGLGMIIIGLIGIIGGILYGLGIGDGKDD